MERIQAQEIHRNNYAQGLRRTGAIEVKTVTEEPFTLRSGRRSYVYINHARLAQDPEGYRAFIDSVGDLLHEAYGENDFIVCNVDSKISPQMVGSLAYTMNKPQIVFRSEELTATEKGSGQQLTGDRSWNLPVAIIDDVATGGDGTATHVAQLIREQFPNIRDIQLFVGLVRNMETPSTFPIHAVFNYETLMQQLWNSLSPEQQQAWEKEKLLQKN